MKLTSSLIIAIKSISSHLRGGSPQWGGRLKFPKTHPSSWRRDRDPQLPFLSPRSGSDRLGLEVQKPKIFSEGNFHSKEKNFFWGNFFNGNCREIFFRFLTLLSENSDEVLGLRLF